MKSHFIMLFLKGIPIGISNILPGISGGTIALVLKIYDELIEAIKYLRFKILIPVVLGALVGILLTANLVTYLMDNYPAFIFSFLFGLILASARYTLNDIKKYDFITVVYILAGFFIAYYVATRTAAVSSTVGDPGIIKTIAAGFLASVSMLLPGISGATVLVLMGLYESILQAVTHFNFVILAIFGTAALTGILSLAWLLSWILKNYRSPLMAVLTGLILGSSFAVLPDRFGVTEIIGILSGIGIVLLPAITANKN